jgi:hypothetical protein
VKIAIDGSERIRHVCAAASDRLAKGVLASELKVGAPGFEPQTKKEFDVDGESLVVWLMKDA